MKYEVQTLTWIDGWINTWSINGDPQYFDTYEDAEFALHDLLKDIHEAYEEGWIADDYDPSDYRIAEVNLSWVEQFDKEFIQKLGRKEMRRYGVRVKFTGYAYVEVDCPNGEDPEEYAIDIADYKNVDEWEMEAVDTEEVDPNE